MRANEWLPSAPVHVQIWQAFGWEIPKYAHLPVMLNPNGKGKISNITVENISGTFGSFGRFSGAITDVRDITLRNIDVKVIHIDGIARDGSTPCSFYRSDWSQNDGTAVH